MPRVLDFQWIRGGERQRVEAEDGASMGAATRKPPPPLLCERGSKNQKSGLPLLLIPPRALSNAKPLAA
jgi:hypothetical protein